MTTSKRDDAGPIDIVYTWVDDAWPGYREGLSKYAQTPVDRDPSRTRDNLDLLRYSLRSVDRFAPWVRNIFLLTCRPQVPPWLNTDHPQIRVVHHDEIMQPAILPTFNSLAIISHLHLIPGLSETFIYLEDDMLLRSALDPASMVTGDGRLKVYPWRYWSPRWQDIANPEAERPWNLALAESNRLLNQRFGEQRRRQLCHMPRLLNREHWRQLMVEFADGITATRTSRFRKLGNVAPEFIYPWMMLAKGKAEMATEAEAGGRSGYVPLENFWPVTVLSLLKAKWRGAHWVTFNDNLPEHPSIITESLVRWQLQAWFPVASRFER